MAHIKKPRNEIGLIVRSDNKQYSQEESDSRLVGFFYQLLEWKIEDEEKQEQLNSVNSPKEKD